MNKPTGFLSAFFGSCCGTAVFFRLRHHTWWRVIFHSLLISLLCGIAAGTAAFSTVKNNTEVMKSAFVSVFGNEVLIGRETIVPKLNPDTPRSAVLPAGGSLIYTGTGKGMKFENIPPAHFTVVWRPADLTVLFSNGKEGFRGGFSDGKISRLTGFNFHDCLQNGSFSRQAERSINFSSILESVLFLLRIYCVAGYILWFLVMSWLYTGVFALVFRIFHASRLHVLTIGSMWKCGIYAGFPPLAVATVWQVLDLPFINYETVYIIGLLVYWMIVISRIENQPNPEEKNSDE